MHKTIYQEIVTELETTPTSRERRFRAKFMRELVLRRLGYEGQMFLPVELLDDYGKTFESYMRVCRQVQAENEHIRGTDYDTKDIYEQKTELELGYEPGHHKRTKQLSLITS